MTLRGRRRLVAFAVVIGIVILLQAKVGERNGSETSAIAALAAIRMSEESYAASNYGYYDTLTCLHDGTCIPGVTGQFAMFDLDIVMRQQWRGYRFEFHAGPAVVPAKQTASPTSMTRFAVVATPIKLHTTANRSFCVDDRRTIYAHAAPSQPQVTGARCVDTSNPVR